MERVSGTYEDDIERCRSTPMVALNQENDIKNAADKNAKGLRAMQHILYAWELGLDAIHCEGSGIPQS